MRRRNIVLTPANHMMPPQQKGTKRSFHDEQLAEIPITSAKRIRTNSSDESSVDSANPPPREGIPICVRIALPDGEQHLLSLTDSTTLRALFCIISAKGWNPKEYVLYRHAIGVYGIDNADLTFRQLQFTTREFLRVIRKDECNIQQFMRFVQQ